MTVHRLPAKKNDAPAGYRMAAKGDRAEIYLYGAIGQDWFGEGVTARQFADDLKKLGAISTIDLRVNSEGGSVFEGKAMYSLLVEHKARVITHIDGLAASAASFIAMAGDEIEIAESAFVMIHNAWTIAIGGADEMRRTGDLLDSINVTIRDVYVARTRRTAAEIGGWMDAETWMTGREAVDRGFADKVAGNLKVAACVRDPARFRNVPAALRPGPARIAAAMSRIRAAAPR